MKSAKRSAPGKKSKGIRTAILAVCLVGIVVSVFFLVINYERATPDTEPVRTTPILPETPALPPETALLPVEIPSVPPEIAPIPAETPSTPTDIPPSATIAEPEPLNVLEKFTELYEQNSDLVGWIRITGTVIDYPVMQSPDSDWDFYLNRNFYGAHDIHGTPYIWPQHDIAEDDLFFIFGHNMRNGSRFADVARYISRDFWERHPTIEFYTLYEGRRYEVAFVFQIFVIENVNQYYHHPQRGIADNVEFPYTFVTTWESEKAFWHFIAHNREFSLYETGVDVDYGDRMIALWTCVGGNPDLRLVVVAVERQYIEGKDYGAISE